MSLVPSIINDPPRMPSQQARLRAQVVNLHERLIERQTDEELKRKAEKARELRGKLWTQEEIDWGLRRADRLYRSLNGLSPRKPG